MNGIVGEMRVEIGAREIARFVHRRDVVAVAHQPLAGFETELRLRRFQDVDQLGEGSRASDRRRGDVGPRAKRTALMK